MAHRKHGIAEQFSDMCDQYDTFTFCVCMCRLFSLFINSLSGATLFNTNGVLSKQGNYTASYLAVMLLTYGATRWRSLGHTVPVKILIPVFRCF
jgi:hypothetical protein